MINDDLEFSISQYIDGALAPELNAELEVRLAEDADARAMLAEYRRLDAAMRSLPLPTVRWDKLAASISSAVDAAGEEPAPHAYRMPAWIRMAAMPLAMAASLLIVAGVGFEIYYSHQSPSGWRNPGLQAIVTPTAPPSTSTVFIDLPADKAAGPVVEQVAIGPSAGVDNSTVAIQDNDIASGPSRVAVASGGVPAHDTASLSSYDME